MEEVLNRFFGVHPEEGERLVFNGGEVFVVADPDVAGHGTCVNVSGQVQGLAEDLLALLEVKA